MCMVSAWMGSETLDLCAVVILAVVERPGRSSSEGLSSVTTTLKSLASSVPVVDCEVAAGGAEQRLIADQRDVALEDLAGQGVDGDVGGLADLDVDDVGLVHLDLGGDDAHVGQGHQRGAFGVLNADDDGLAFAHGLVGHDAVKGRDGDGEVEHVLVGAQRGFLGLHVAARRVGLRLGLVELGDGLGQRGDVECRRRPFWRRSPAWP
jgi:hypothetical protein